MDIVAHTLWTTAAAGYGRKKLHKPLHLGWAALWGVFPDLFSFTIPAAVKIWWWLSGATTSLLPQPGGPRFQYVWELYNASHSAVVFALVFGIVWLVARRPVYSMLGWALHILLDCFTHSGMFAIRFLWPGSAIAFDGVRWENRWCLLANYCALAFVYFMYCVRARREKRSTTGRLRMVQEAAITRQSKRSDAQISD